MNTYIYPHFLWVEFYAVVSKKNHIMKLFKTSSLIMLISTALILTSCGSSSNFSKRKYRKGVFKEYSVKVKRDETKKKEVFYVNQQTTPETTQLKPVTTNEIAGYQTEDSTQIDKEIDVIKTNQASSIKRNEDISKVKIVESKPNNNLNQKIGESLISKKPKKRILTEDQQIKRGRIIGFLSIFLNILFFILCTCFFLTQIYTILIVLAVLFFTMMTITIISLVKLCKLRKQGTSDKNKTKLKRTIFLNALGLLLMSLGLTLTSSILILTKGGDIGF